MFQKIPDQGEKIKIYYEGRCLKTVKGLTVAAALLSNGEIQFRESEVSGQPRSPYCLMGVCFECLLEIDGKPNQQSCMTIVRDGMKINKQCRCVKDPDVNS